MLIAGLVFVLIHGPNDPLLPLGFIGIATFGRLLGTTHDLRDGFMTCLAVGSAGTAAALLLTALTGSHQIQPPWALAPDAHRAVKHPKEDRSCPSPAPSTPAPPQVPLADRQTGQPGPGHVTGEACRA